MFPLGMHFNVEIQYQLSFGLMKDYLYFLKIFPILKVTYCIICGVIYLDRSATANCSHVQYFLCGFESL